MHTTAMGVGRIFSMGALGDFSKFLQGVPKVVKFVFSHLKLRKLPFLQKKFKIQGARLPLPTPMTTAASSEL